MYAPAIEKTSADPTPLSIRNPITASILPENSHPTAAAAYVSIPTIRNGLRPKRSARRPLHGLMNTCVNANAENVSPTCAPVAPNDLACTGRIGVTIPSPNVAMNMAKAKTTKVRLINAPPLPVSGP